MQLASSSKLPDIKVFACGNGSCQHRPKSISLTSRQMLGGTTVQPYERISLFTSPPNSASSTSMDAFGNAAAKRNVLQPKPFPRM
eukprot:3259110-Amphidinium_carterae.1